MTTTARVGSGIPMPPADTAQRGEALGIPARDFGGFATLAGYGAAHMIEDAACAALVVRVSSTETFDAATAWGLVLAYNLLAFGTQPFTGLAVDRRQAPRLAAIVGCVLTAGAIAAGRLVPFAAVCLAGIGNSLFHAGGGAVSLLVTPGRATGPGIFVAPGALGLLLGTLAVKRGWLPLWCMALAVLAVAAAMPRFRPAAMDRGLQTPPSPPAHVEILLGLLCFTVAVRSLCGSAVGQFWKPDATALIALTIVGSAGKATGGVLCDRWGWVRVAAGATILSAPLVVLGRGELLPAVAGVFLLQATAGVTLAAISRLFPGRPSFSFGLASLALILGAFPLLAGAGPALARAWLISLLLLLSGCMLAVALARMRVASK